MKTLSLLLVIVFVSVSSFAQQNETISKLVTEGMELNDKGDYGAAIKKYDEALLIDKNDFGANYEKSVSCLSSKKYDDCILLCKFLLEKYADDLKLKGVYINYGSALDDKGDSEQAIRIFEKGIKKFPGFFLLYFNKGLTQARIKKWDDAAVSFMLALKNKPNHAGSLYYMALIQENSNKVAAVLSCLAFLAVEPEGKRAEMILKYLTDLMGSFANKGKDGGSVISIDAGGPDNKKKENNFSMVQMMLGLTAAPSLADSVKAKTDVEKLSLQVQMLVTSLSVGKKDGKGLYWDIYAPFFIAMKEQGFVPVFAHIAYITSGNPENIQWISENQDKFAAFNKWVEGYKWNKAGDK